MDTARIPASSTSSPPIPSSATAPDHPSLGLRRAAIYLPLPPRLEDEELIAERVLINDVAGYIRFRAVCRTWRRCSDDPRRHNAPDSRFHPRLWLIMLREEEEEEEGAPAAAAHRRRFLNVATGQSIVMDLPELDLTRVRAHREGLLVLVEEHTLAVRVLNPFTRRLTELPWAATLLPCRKKRTRKKKCYARDLADDGDLSVTGAGLAGDRTLALSFHRGSLVVAKSGEARWTTLVGGHSSSSFPSSLPFAGCFYCVVDGAVMALNNVAENNKPPQLEVVAMLARHCSLMMLDTVHLGRTEAR